MYGSEYFFPSFVDPSPREFFLVCQLIDFCQETFPHFMSESQEFWPFSSHLPSSLIAFNFLFEIEILSSSVIDIPAGCIALQFYPYIFEFISRPVSVFIIDNQDWLSLVSTIKLTLTSLIDLFWCQLAMIRYFFLIILISKLNKPTDTLFQHF